VLDDPPPADDAKVPDDPKLESLPGNPSPETESGALPAFLGADGDVTVEVGKAIKVGEGMSAYASYPVTASTTSPAFKSETSSVSRRFSDFTKLRKTLQKAHPGVIVYPLPEKTVTTSPFHPEFLEQRRVGLDTFARAVAAHPTLRRSEHLRAFLEDPGGGHPAAEDPGGASARDAGGASPEATASVSTASSGARDAEEAWYQRGAAGTALSAVDGWFKSAAIAAESFVHGAGADTVLMEEDPEYLEASEYLLAVEDRLKRAARASDEVVSAVNSGGLILGNFGDNAALLGDCEERGAKMLLGETAGGLGQAFRQVGAAAHGGGRREAGGGVPRAAAPRAGPRARRQGGGGPAQRRAAPAADGASAGGEAEGQAGGCRRGGHGENVSVGPRGRWLRRRRRRRGRDRRGVRDGGLVREAGVDDDQGCRGGARAGGDRGGPAEGGGGC
jgi:hypothetical protein